MSDKSVLRQALTQRLKQFAPDYVCDTSMAVCSEAYAAIDWSCIKTVLSYTPIFGANEIDPHYLTERLYDIKVDKIVPLKNATMPAEKYDLIIVPVLGFRSDGYRLGRGGGWYDRLIAAQPQAITVGLAYACTNVDFTPESHDKRLTYIFTS